jgi:signal transduction histidine kinase/CheY-like chemotaxis protein
MTSQQRIVRVRRQYNKWVANQTLEDYALRFTALSARKWSSFRVANTAIGAISFLALEAIGGTITLQYGFSNAALAIAVVGLLILLTSIPISYYAAKFGVDIDLLTRGAGFGYIGSTVTSLIYASFTFIFFALEAAIMSLALELCFDVPLTIGYLISALLVIPLVTHGITFISRFQLWTQPFWIVLHIVPFVFIGATGISSIDGWTRFQGQHGPADGSFNILVFGAAAAVVFSLVAQIGEQVDFLRFMPRHSKGRRLQWWSSLLAAGPGWIVLGTVKLFAGSFLAYFALSAAVPAEHAAEPTQMYLIAFQQMISSPEVAIALTGIFVILSQIKINVTNAYAGSIAWSNFFSRLTHSHPGRVVWLVFNVAIALVLMEMGIFRALEHILGLYANIAVAWVGAIVADLVVNKPLGLSPKHIEFKRAHLYDINPVGVGAMVAASLLSTAAYFGLLGETAQALASFLAMGTAFVLAPVIALATKGKYYLARSPIPQGERRPQEECCICELKFDAEDMAHCPVYSGPICSLCCSLDARCHDRCKVDARFHEQIIAFLSAFLPARIVTGMNSRVGQYISLMVLVCSISGLFFGLIYIQATLDPLAPKDAIGTTLWNVFFVTALLAGVTCWLFVLATESRRVAQEESTQQTNLLMREIRAHERTDEELQKAKEAAEAANEAKSRYMAGISHELHTPLNTILGYAQILENDPALPRHREDSVKTIRQSGEHLAGLIEGLLDISKIEAGQLNIYRDEFHLGEFLDQLVDMFRLQAAVKNIRLEFDRPKRLPEIVQSDEKRLRQILINLLSNAIKYTDSGHVKFTVRYGGEVADFIVEDTGRGIRAEDMDRIFRPFERIHEPGRQAPPGTGLGLTITKLLTEVLGGEITVESTYGKGSTFRVKMMLSTPHTPSRKPRSMQRIYGYKGRRLTVIAMDDEADHREMINEILSPLGFIVFTAVDGPQCLELAREHEADLFLLDISLPGMSGWEVTSQLRQMGYRNTPIIMVSAVAGAESDNALGTHHHDAIVSKPMRIDELLTRIGQLLKIEWIHDMPVPAASRTAESLRAEAARLPQEQLRELRSLAQIGHVRAVQEKLSAIELAWPELESLTSELRVLVDRFDFERLDTLLGDLQREQVG